jgi:hypothetical protein
VLAFVWCREDWTWTPVWLTAIFLLAFVALAHAFLLVAPIEYIHYPQYAVVAFLLGRAGIAPEIAWLGATALGAIDELHQFRVLRRGRPEYFDWNDVVLNAVGAAYGIVLLLAGRGIRLRLTFSDRQVAGALTAAAILSLALAPVPFSPYLTETPRGTYFRVLAVFEAAVLMGLVGGVEVDGGTTQGHQFPVNSSQFKEPSVPSRTSEAL